MSDKPGSGKQALITGASRGIGEAFATVLADEGYRLVICSRKDEELNRVAGVLNTKYQASVSPVAMDLTEPGAAQKLADELAARDFTPDVVINNAGFGKYGSTTNVAVSEQVNMIDLNVRVTSELSLMFLPGMLERKGGGVLNVSSLTAFMPGPYMPVYHASKSFIVSFTESLASEHTGSGVTFSVLCPGYVPTGFQARADMEGARMLKLAPKMSAEEVATIGWEGFKRGERIIVPGAFNKFVPILMKLMPRNVVAQFLRRVNKPAVPVKSDEAA